MRWPPLWLVFVAMHVACASPTPVPIERPAPAPIPQKKSPPRFLVVSRNAPLFASADATTPLLQYRSLDVQADMDAASKQEMMRYTELRKKRYADEIKRERKRMRKMKKRAQRIEYAEKQRRARAAGHLKAMEKKALKLGAGHPAERFVVLAVMEETHDRFKVHNLLGEEETPHCYQQGLAGIGKARMNLWVNKSDVERVTKRQERVEIWNGSAVETTAGVVVLDGESGRQIYVDGYRVSAPIPDEATSYTYQPTTHFDAPITDQTFTDIALAEGLLKFNKDAVLPFNPWVDMYVTSTLRVDTRLYATTQTRCASFTVHTDDAYMEPSGRRATLRLSPTSGAVVPPLVTEGTRLFSPEGASIGRAWDTVHLGKPEPDENGRSCFRREVWPAETDAPFRSLVWCVDPKNVSR